MKQISLLEKLVFVIRECIRPIIGFINNRPVKQAKTEIVHISPVAVEGSFRIKHGLVKLQPQIWK